MRDRIDGEMSTFPRGEGDGQADVESEYPLTEVVDLAAVGTHEVSQRPLQEQDQRNWQHKPSAGCDRSAHGPVDFVDPAHSRLPPIWGLCYRFAMPEPNHDVLLGRLVRAMGGVPGIRAIVLGGSRARGEATVQSDYDIGLYYEAANPIDIGRLAKAAMLLPGAASSSVTAIGEWGPWINGGAWLTVEGTRVDLLYRELDKVRDVIEACHGGRIERVYQPGHPHAFVSAIYMGEVALCRVLWDPENALMVLKRRCNPYPQALREALVRSFFWEARFALENADHGSGRDDPAYVAGCGFRAVACLCHTLFALNGVYLLNEKRAVQGVERLARRPAHFAGRVAQAIGAGAAGLHILTALVDETADLLNA